MHEHTISKKVEVIVEHFNSQVQGRIGGQAKAMVVTRSRLHAVRYKQAIDAYLAEHNYPFKALVAFSGTVKDGGIEYTETGMNGFPEKQTASTFTQKQYRLLVVAEKFQTGYDMPLLHTMYVDKKLKGLHAVQTLSRLNRTHPPHKTETFVLDFANAAENIQRSFEPYYERTILTESTDPNLLYDLQTRIDGFHLFTQEEVDMFAQVYFNPKGTQDRLFAALQPAADRYKEIAKEDQSEFRAVLSDYTRLYSFLAQVVTFVDPDLEKLFVYACLLLRWLPVERERLPLEIQQAIDLESYRLEKTSEGKIKLDRGKGEIKPENPLTAGAFASDLEALSHIINELNQRFGTDFADDDRLVIRQLEEQLAQDERLEQTIRVNAPENAMLTFRQVLEDLLQEMIDTHFKFYKQVDANPEFAETLTRFLFDRYRSSLGLGSVTG